tara:strand:- start:30 stop:782 length:753 start_codon:yes stop_codon:yes gene_type:complete
MTNNKTYFVANWKMHGNLNSVHSIKNVIKLSKKPKYKNAKIIYCPPYTLIRQFVEKTKKTKIDIGAQNCHFENNFGSFTGSVNSNMIKNVGSKFVIIGHSENRTSGDTNKSINLKIKSAIKANLKVIFCFGETLKEKRNKMTNKVLNYQIKKGLDKIKNIKNIFFAYEPVWSIGTGIIPKINELNKQVREIKKIIKKKYKAKNAKILYGGSVNSQNIVTLKKISSIKGFLIGGASLNSKNFIDIIKKTIN